MLESVRSTGLISEIRVIQLPVGRSGCGVSLYCRANPIRPLEGERSLGALSASASVFFSNLISFISQRLLLCAEASVTEEVNKRITDGCLRLMLPFNYFPLITSIIKNPKLMCNVQITILYDTVINSRVKFSAVTASGFVLELHPPATKHYDRQKCVPRCAVTHQVTWQRC